MIGQVTIGKSFGGVVRYVMEKLGAEVLDQHGLRSADPTVATQDFNTVRRVRPKVKNAVWHTSISFAHQDRLNTNQMIQIGREYLDRMNVLDHQFLIVKHNDTKHEHMHIIINRVSFDGTVASDRFCKNRTAQVCDQLEAKYGLTVAREQGKGRPKKKDKVPLKNKAREEIRTAIEEALASGITNFQALEQALINKGMTMKLQRQRTGRINGITFGKQGFAMKGSAIDKTFSYGRILKAMAHNTSQEKDNEAENENRRKN